MADRHSFAMKPTRKESSGLANAAGVFALFLALYILTAGGHLYSPDEEIMFRTTEALASRATLAIEPIGAPDGSTFASAAGKDGREYAQYGVGNSLLAMPLFAVGKLATRFVSDEAALRMLDFRTTGQAIPEAGPGRGHALLRRFAVSFQGALVGAATCALLFLMVLSIERDRRRWEAVRDEDLDVPHDDPYASPVQAAWLTALLYGAATMAWPHARTFFSEPPATFFVLLAFAVAAAPGRLRGITPLAALGSGAAFAAALLTRLDSAFVFPALVLFLLLRNGEASAGGCLGAALRRPAAAIFRAAFAPAFLGRVAAFALPLLVAVGVVLGLNRLHFGGWFASAYADQPEGIRFTTPLVAGLYGFLFSVGKSVFLFSPALLLGVAGFGRFARRHGALAAGAATVVLLSLLIHARWQNWAGGWCWGPRHIFLAHVFAVLPAAGFVLRWTRSRAAVFFTVILLGAGVQLYGASQNFIDYYVLYYRTPDTVPNAWAMYSGEDVAPMRLVAPINDSIYVPQNSQWARYSEMAQLGYTDNLWLRLMNRNKVREPHVR